MERKVVTKHSSSRRRVTDDGGWGSMQPFPRTLEQRFGDVVNFDEDFADFAAQQPSYFLTSASSQSPSSSPSSRPVGPPLSMMRMARTPIPVTKGDVQTTDTDFKVAVDVSNFDPEDIEIKIVDNELTVHGKHEEKADDHGKISREFTRRYTLPPDVDPTAVTSSLAHDGILAIQAPRNPPKPPKDKKIPIKVESKALVGGPGSPSTARK